MSADGYFTPEHLLRLYARAPGAFWRHDVDVSLEAAVRMARFAELAGRRATFYVMARSEFYNPFSAAGARALVEIRRLGHEVGMHVDASGLPAEGAVVADRRIFNNSGLSGIVNPRLVSFHMPGPEVLWRNFDEFASAYAERWKDAYVSDSRREWDATKDRRVTSGVQVALHPEHWFSPRIDTEVVG